MVCVLLYGVFLLQVYLAYMTVGHKCHGMGHVGYSRDCPLCPKGTMGQDRQHNMTHGMGHVGYSRDCPLCP